MNKVMMKSFNDILDKNHKHMMELTKYKNKERCEEITNEFRRALEEVCKKYEED